MKKIVVVMFCLIFLAGCGKFEFKVTENSQKFKELYESYNEVKKDDGSNKYKKLEISEANPFYELTVDEVVNFLQEGTGIIYFGKPTCPWCRHIVNNLMAVAEETNNSKIYYFDSDEIKKNNDDRYQKILEILNDYLRIDNYTQKETDENYDENKKWLYVPDVYAVKDGKIVGHHANTVESHILASDELTDDQKQELKAIYKELFNSIKRK